MAKPSDIAIIASISSLQLTAVSISHSLSHRERQAGTGKDVTTIDRADERIDQVEDIGGILCVGRGDTKGQKCD
jgi:hypothetical protein